ncbi:hypothetical protein [Nesterenkonia jeotgali]|uniref:hypothetical protein n=1 Tax=Nesterenkonia jeotgali TaxID=317018 RepID=UPI0012ECBB53|nr:hypothetical protein [Nesterenkonia jeotgali]
MNTRDLRKALQAVTPHAHDNADTGLAVVHFTPDDQNLYLQASNGYSQSLAIVSIWDHRELTGSPDEDSFDLTIDTAKELLKVFREKKKPENELDDQLSITVRPDEITVTDVSGLFPGKSWTVPNTANSENFPNIPLLFANAIQNGPRGIANRVLASGDILKRFSTAAYVYGYSLTLEPTTRSRMVLISCGDSFLGSLVEPKPTPEDDERHQEWRDDWRGRLPSLGAAITSSRNVRAEVA